MANSSTYTALDLLNKVIDFTNRSPYSEEWSFEKQKENPPRFVRLQQIQALMEAFVPGLASSKEIDSSFKHIYHAETFLFSAH